MFASRLHCRPLVALGTQHPLLRGAAGPAVVAAAAPAAGFASSTGASAPAVAAPAGPLPTTVEELRDVVAANAPVFHLHPDEQYFPCSVEFFLEQARLCIMRNVLMRRKIERGQCPPPPPSPLFRCSRTCQSHTACVAGKTSNVSVPLTLCPSCATAYHGFHLLSLSTTESDSQVWLCQEVPRCCAVVVPFGQLDAEALKHAYEVHSKQRLQLHLRRSARGGQPNHLPQVPVYAHVRARTRSP